ncbi:hypothetical protein PG991_008355 [Apiospora marii]|uniref:Aminoglycoside phosphotransferase domain-containing protein n=1 Tax=Apiospora marii TaxID=335849 RepID=A0ABR1RQL6_9PEZI
MEEDEGLHEIHQVLHGYFENDTRRRFQLEGPIASGADSIAWGVQQTTCGQACQRIVLKTPKWADLGGGEEDEETTEDGSTAWNNDSNILDPIENEKKWLRCLILSLGRRQQQVLRWAKHVMNIVEIPADPLNRRKSPLRRHGVENWMFIEWVEHGTLHRLVRRAREENIEYLPNRMLWRFFMCQETRGSQLTDLQVIRMCIAMAWPPEQPIGPPEGAFEIIRQKPPLTITHGDLHNENGPFELNPEYLEHDITPVLKMIDLGKMSGNDHRGANFDATKENIRDVGNLMHELCTLLNPWERSDLYDGRQTAEFQPPIPINNVTTPIETEAVALVLLPPRSDNETGNEIPCPRLDPDLRLLICSCLAVHPRFRPGLAELFQAVVEAVHVRDAVWYSREGAGYCNPAMETDESISGLLQLLLRDARTS